MVNMKVNKSNISLSVGGPLEDIVAEILYGIHKIHEEITAQDEDAASEFEIAMKMGLLHVFNPDEADEVKELLNSLIEHLDDDEDDEDDEEDDDGFIEFLEKMSAKKKAKRK